MIRKFEKITKLSLHREEHRHININKLFDFPKIPVKHRKEFFELVEKHIDMSVCFYVYGKRYLCSGSRQNAREAQVLAHGFLNGLDIGYRKGWLSQIELQFKENQSKSEIKPFVKINVI